MPETYWLETLGCPKNRVDSDKLAGTLVADGYRPARRPEDADLVVVNTCAFIEAAREESVDTVLALSEARHDGARLVVTGCLAERCGPELAAALPEVDLVAGFGTPVTLRRRNRFDLLELPRPAASAPWAYIKVAEGCDRRCGFCAIPSFRGGQRSRSVTAVLEEIEALGEKVREVVLVAQDLASFGLDRAEATPRRRGSQRPLVELVAKAAERVSRVRLLYLYPSSLDDALIDAIAATGVPYFDLSLQHVARPLLKRMRRFGDGARFLERIERIRATAPDAALRSSFILGYPGETEEDHDRLLAFLEQAELDWAGFFPFSEEAGTYAAGLSEPVPPGLAVERLNECAELQDRITAQRRADLVGRSVAVLVDAPRRGRSHREAPEIDGLVHVPDALVPGEIVSVTVTAAAGPDLWAEAAGPR